MTESYDKKLAIAILGTAGVYISYKVISNRGNVLSHLFAKDKIQGLSPFSETGMRIITERIEQEVQTDTYPEPSAPPKEDLNIREVPHEESNINNPLPSSTVSRIKQINGWFERVVHFNFY